jgi:hypothetical protein
MTRRPLALGAALALALCLAACGGGGSSSSTSTAASIPSTSAAAPPGFLKHAESSAETAAERRKAGRAAAFVAPKSDNSVPTFGSEANAPERDQAEENLKTYLQARTREDWASACRGLAKPTREGYEKLASSSAKSTKATAPSCAQVLAALSKGADLSDPLTGSLLSLRVHGVSGFALFYGPGHQQYMVPMNREGGEWRPTQATAIAYPPGAPTATSP